MVLEILQKINIPLRGRERQSRATAPCYPYRSYRLNHSRCRCYIRRCTTIVAIAPIVVAIVVAVAIATLILPYIRKCIENSY